VSEYTFERKTPRAFQPDRLRTLLMDTEAKYAARDQNFAVYERWYFKEHGDPVFSLDGIRDEPITPNNLPTHMINMAVSMLMQETPSAEVLVDETKERQKKLAELAEKVFMGTWYLNGEDQEKELLGLYFHNLLLYGWGVTYTVWDPTRVPPSLEPQLLKDVLEYLNDPSSPDASLVADEETEEERERDFPIVIEVPHPKEIYAVDGGSRGRWSAQFRRTRATLANVEDQFGIELPRTVTDQTAAEAFIEDQTEVTVYDVWKYIGRQIWHCIFIDGLPRYVRNENNTWTKDEAASDCYFIKPPCHMPEYARLPYDIRFCFPTSSSDPARYGLSLLYTVIDTVAAAERLQSRHELIIDNYADPAMKAKYNSQESGSAVPPTITKQPGEVIHLDEGQGQDVDILQWRGSPPDIFQMWERMYELSKFFGFDPNVEGTTGLDSFVKRSGIIAKLTLPIKAAESGLAATHARIIRLWTKLVGSGSLTVRGRLTVDSRTQAYALSVKGTQLQGMDQIAITLHARFPFEELQNVTAAKQASDGDNPIISLERARTQYMRIQDADAEAEKIKQEKVNNPMLYVGEMIKLGFQQLQAQQQQLMMQALQPPPPAPQGMTAGMDPISRGLVQGGMPDQQMGLVDLQGNTLSTGNIQGAPSPTAPNDAVFGQPGRGRPPGS